MKVLSPTTIIYKGDFTSPASVRSVRLRSQTITDLELKTEYVLPTLPGWSMRFDDAQRFWTEEWLCKPLIEVKGINDRLDAVSALKSGRLQQDIDHIFYLNALRRTLSFAELGSRGISSEETIEKLPIIFNLINLARELFGILSKEREVLAARNLARLIQVFGSCHVTNKNWPLPLGNLFNLLNPANDRAQTAFRQRGGEWKNFAYQEYSKVYKEFEKQNYYPDINVLADAVREFDIYLSLAKWTSAFYGEFTCPKITSRRKILTIKNGRHMPTETLLSHQEMKFCSNDINLNPERFVQIVMGEHHGGKSTFLKMIGLISLLGQTGSFVPAGTGTTWGVWDQLFTHMDVRGEPTKGLSNFEAAMVNGADILNNATPFSLVLVDEFGIYTDPVQGKCLALSTLIELAQRKIKTIWVSHFGETATLGNDPPFFLTHPSNFKILPGASPPFSAFAHAQKLGMPQRVITRAERILKRELI